MKIEEVRKMFRGDEKRKYRRLELALPIEVRKIGPPLEPIIEEATTTNVSLGGTYFKTRTRKDVKPEQDVYISISVPREMRRQFPFSRLAGKARVVRVEDLPGNALDPLAKQGIALEFSGDLISLAAVQRI